MRSKEKISEKKRLVVEFFVLILIAIFIVGGPMYILHTQRLERAKLINEKKESLLQTQVKVDLVSSGRNMSNE